MILNVNDNHYNKFCQYADFRWALCHILLIVMLNVVKLGVTLNDNVVMLSVIILNVNELCVVVLSVMGPFDLVQYL
jgi:hypothetical protein